MPWTTPRDWTTGEMVTEAMLDQQISGNFNAAFPLGVDGWTAFTPTLTQSGAVTKTVTYAKYQRIGRLIVVNYDLAITGAGTTANAITLGIPVTAATGAMGVGSFRYFDAGNTIYTGAVVLNSTTTMQFYVSGNGNQMGVNPTFAMANGDNMQVGLQYEAAS